MIEQMKFMSIIGPMEDIDRIAETYLTRYEMHLENDPQEIRSDDDLRPYIEVNPYKNELQRAEELAAAYSSLLPKRTEKEIGLEDAVKLVRKLDGELGQLSAEKDALNRQKEEEEGLRDKVAPFIGLNYDVKQILQFRYIKFRFGSIAKRYYADLCSYVEDTADTVMSKCEENQDTVWLVYFVPASRAPEVDAVYEQKHFERCYLPDEYEGTPTQANQDLEAKISDLQKQIEEKDRSITDTVKASGEDLAAALLRLRSFSVNFDVREKAALTNNKIHNFYILCGWMREKDAYAAEKEIEKEEDTFCILEEDPQEDALKAPTKLKNPALFKPFEMYVEMYGLPDYHEFDPTILIGITYSILFGFMFGDAGQGLLLLIGGFLLYHFRKMRLAGIISCCGFFSVIFGILFGSVFGFETIIPALWLKPQEAMSNLPFIGRLNTVFAVAIVVGMGIILLSMVLNIITSLRMHDPEKSFFDTNGVAGLVFYLALVIVVMLYMTGNPLPATGVLIVMFVLPLAVMFLKEPLTALAEKKAKKIESSVGMFLIQGFFEMFEVLLSYFSNTLSFVRVGAFAVSHAAMMGVVLMLGGAESGGSINWAVIVIGNLFVCGMEGLVVGIQVLRLEYYEIFSRFYRGDGRAFTPYEQTAMNRKLT